MLKVYYAYINKKRMKKENKLIDLIIYELQQESRRIHRHKLEQFL